MTIILALSLGTECATGVRLASVALPVGNVRIALRALAKLQRAGWLSLVPQCSAAPLEGFGLIQCCAIPRRWGVLAGASLCDAPRYLGGWALGRVRAYVTRT